MAVVMYWVGDGKRGRKQIYYGLMTDPEGRPIGIDVFPGDTFGPESFKIMISKACSDVGLKDIVFVGDRGVITKTRIAELRGLDGAGWVTALKAADIAALAADDGPLQMSLFDEQDLTEISHPDYPGEHLICCRDPVLALSRAYKREDLLVATGEGLAKIAKWSLRHPGNGSRRTAPVYRYRDPLGRLATLTRQTVNFDGQLIEKFTIPTPVRPRAFELLESRCPSPLRSHDPAHALYPHLTKEGRLSHEHCVHSYDSA